MTSTRAPPRESARLLAAPRTTTAPKTAVLSEDSAITRDELDRRLKQGKKNAQPAAADDDGFVSRPRGLATQTERVFYLQLQRWIDHKPQKTVCFNPFLHKMDTIDGDLITVVPHGAVNVKLCYHIEDVVPKTCEPWGYFDPYPPDEKQQQQLYAGVHAAPSADTTSDDSNDDEEANLVARSNHAINLPPEYPHPFFRKNGLPTICMREFNHAGLKNWYHALKEMKQPWVSAFPHPVMLVPEVVQVEWPIILDPTGSMSTLAFHSKLFGIGADSAINIHLPPESCQEMFGTLDANNSGWIVPVGIWITAENNTLPFPMAAQLYSIVSDGGPQVKWFAEATANPDTDSEHRVIGHLVVPGRTQTSARVLKFQHDDSRLCQADFTRWASTDFDDVFAKLKTSDCASASEKDNMYEITAPPMWFRHVENIMQFLCISEWFRILRVSEARGLNHKELAAKIRKSSVKKDTHSFRVHKTILRQLFHEKRKLIDRNRTMMQVDKGLRFELALLTTDKKRAMVIENNWRTRTGPINRPGVSNGAAAPVFDNTDFSIHYSCNLHIAFLRVPKCAPIALSGSSAATSTQDGDQGDSD